MFNGFDPSRYDAEVRERWGHTDAYKESARRVASYGEEQWGEIKAQAQEIEQRFAELKRSGEPADGEPARAAAERARLHIDRWFYPCSREMHRALGEMYVADTRFATNYEKAEPGSRPTYATRSPRTPRTSGRMRRNTIEVTPRNVTRSSLTRRGSRGAGVTAPDQHPPVLC